VERDKPKKIGIGRTNFAQQSTAAKFVLPVLNPIFLANFVPLDVDVTGNITAKICEIWSEFSSTHFCPLDFSELP
jgi:hypothetical protein